MQIHVLFAIILGNYGLSFFKKIRELILLKNKKIYDKKYLQKRILLKYFLLNVCLKMYLEKLTSFNICITPSTFDFFNLFQT